MIEQVHIAGYKCLRDVQVDVGPFNVLIGRNDTGKSSFLQMLHELSYWARGESYYLRRRAQNGRVGPRLIVRANGVEIGSGFDGAVWRSRIGSSVLDLAPWDGPALVAQPDFKTAGPSLLASRPLSIDPPRIAAISERGSGVLDELIASRGQGTAAHFVRLALRDRNRYEVAQQALRIATGGRVREIIVDEKGDGYALSFGLHDGTVIPASDASQGILVYTCFLAIVHRDDPPSALLIEEPETGVHPLRLKEIVDLLRSLTTRGVQIFLTTHSPDLLSWCKPEELLVFWRPNADSGTSIHKLPPDFNERIAMGDSLGQIWASSGEEGLLDMLGEVKPFEREPPP